MDDTALADPLPGSDTAPWSESDQAAALDAYGILDTAVDPEFDDIATLAAAALDAPIAVVNLITSDRQWFKAEIGIGVRASARSFDQVRDQLLSLRFSSSSSFNRRNSPTPSPP